MPISYEELKTRFQRSKEAFKSEFTSNRRLIKSVIRTIAKSPNDGDFPLGMLEVLEPQLARALASWTSGGYEDIRRAQETDMVKAGTLAHHLETLFPLLPLWHGEANHYSKDASWFNQLEGERLELKSFMGCCAPGYTFAYAIRPAAILKFTSLRTARLVGALTKENCEGEVLLPKGAVFRVVSLSEKRKTICLEECVCSRHSGITSSIVGVRTE